METIQILDKPFSLYIDKTTIEQRIAELSETISQTYQDQNPLLIGILNGSVFFCTQLCKGFHFDCQLLFTKVSSYAGTVSTGTHADYTAPDVSLHNRHVLIIEDIVDTGLTLDFLHTQFQQQQPLSLRTITLFYKPEAFKGRTKPDYIGFSIDNSFIVGYGLDYNGYGRTLENIYIAHED